VAAAPLADLQGFGLQHLKLAMKAVILAGGKGRRLFPFTTNFPKPLMPVGERPILEILLERLKQDRVNDIIIATGHLEELVRAYFGDGAKWGLKICYSREDKPMGTAGPLDLVRADLTETFLLMNGDTLSDVSFRKLLERHEATSATATVALFQRNVFVDFGVVETVENDGAQQITGWKEKPTLTYLVSTGIYVLSPAALSFLPKGEFMNLPDLLLRIKDAGRRVLGYVHQGYWLDIGRPEDYEKACQDFGNL
jgi:NDP-sugar pyrophosphorylase family protein